MEDHVVCALEKCTLEEKVDQVAPTVSPFLCPGCQTRFQCPKVFPGCYHSICESCSQKVDPDTLEVACPRCKSKCLPSDVLDDRLLQFLLKVPEAAPSRSMCANCEEEATLFCTTCSQSLCDSCRSLTHATKMFSSHTLVPQQQHSRGANNMICPVHEKEYVMYSMDTSRLLCMVCFAEIDGSSKSHAVDLTSAYTSSAQRLQSSVAKLEALKGNVLESIEKIEGVLEETEQNAVSSAECIEQVMDKLESALESKRKDLLEAVDRQRSDKLRLLQSQLTDLTEYSVVVKGSLETGNIFSGSTSVYQFLDLVTDMTDRLEHTFDLPHQLAALTGSHIFCHCRAHVIKCVDEALGPNMHSVTGSNFKIDTEGSTSQSHWRKPTSSSTGTAPDSLSEGPPETSSAMSYLWRQHSRSRNVSPSCDLFEHGRHLREPITNDTSLVSVYSERCNTITVVSKSLQLRSDSLKKHVQELNQEVAGKRSQPREPQVADLLAECGVLESDLASHKLAVTNTEGEFAGAWKEMLERVDRSKAQYASQVKDVEKMRSEMKRLLTILNSIQPYVISLSAVSEQLNPVLGEHSKLRAQREVMSDLLVEISSTTVNTRQRVQAIRTAEDLRLTSVERKRSNPLEDNLIRTKELLKSRPAQQRRASGTTSIGTHGSLSPMSSKDLVVYSPLSSKSDSCMGQVKKS